MKRIIASVSLVATAFYLNAQQIVGNEVVDGPLKIDNVSGQDGYLDGANYLFEVADNDRSNIRLALSHNYKYETTTNQWEHQFVGNHVGFNILGMAGGTFHFMGDKWGSAPAPMSSADLIDNYSIAKISDNGRFYSSGQEFHLGYDFATRAPKRVLMLPSQNDFLFINTHSEVGTAGTVVNSKLCITNNAYWSSSVPMKSDAMLSVDGKVTIGETVPTNSFSNYMLSVDGSVVAKEIVCQDASWADYVFKQDYKLKPLSEVKSFIKLNGHLPDVPSEKEISEEGLALAEMQKIQMQKIEELTLYLLQMKEENSELKKRLETLEGNQN